MPWPRKRATTAIGTRPSRFKNREKPLMNAAVEKSVVPAVIEIKHSTKTKHAVKAGA